jgi:hypothetical protein
MIFPYMHIIYFDHIHALLLSLSLLSSPFFSFLSTNLVVLLYFHALVVLCVLFSSNFHKWNKTCHTFLCRIGLFHLTWWVPVLSVFPANDIILFFLMAYLVKFRCVYIYHIFLLSIYPLMDIYADSILWLLWKCQDKHGHPGK